MSFFLVNSQLFYYADEQRLNLLEKSEYAGNDQSVTVAHGASEDHGKKDAV